MSLSIPNLTSRLLKRINETKKQAGKQTNQSNITSHPKRTSESKANKQTSKQT